MLFRNVGSTRRACRTHQSEQRIRRTPGVAEQELDCLADQVCASPVRPFRQRPEPAILSFGQVELDTYH